MRGSAPSHRRILVCLVLVALTLAVYARTLTYGFVNFDDDHYVIENSMVNSGLTTDNVARAFIDATALNWHPLTWISHMTDVSLFGLDARGHHLVNLLLHAVNTVLLFLLLTSATGALWLSALVGLLFAVHPLQVESVAWVAERKNVLSTSFWILTMISYFRYARSPSAARMLPVVILFALGLMSKPMLVTVPLVLILMDYWPLGRWRGGRDSAVAAPAAGNLLLEKVPLLALAAASSLTTYVVQLRGGAVREFELFPLTARVANAFISYAAYLGKMLWPSGLAVYYPHPGREFSTFKALAAAGLLVLLTTAALSGLRRRPSLAVGWLWYLVALLPVLGLIQVGPQAMADRYTYVPLIGIYIALAWMMPDLSGLSRNRRLLALSAVGLVACILMAVSAAQTRHWKNGFTLMERAIAIAGKGGPGTPEARTWFLHYNLGSIYSNAGRHAEAVSALTKAIEGNPESPEAYYNLGNSYSALGRSAEAAGAFRRAVQLYPNFADAYFNLGNAYLMLGMVRESRWAFDRAAQLDRQGFSNPLSDSR